MATSSTPLPAAALDLVIFGGVGDLSVRKLLPALYMAHLHNNLPEQTRIHALGRQTWDRAAFLHFIQEKVRGFIGEKAYTDEAWATFVRRLTYSCVDATDAASFLDLKAEMQPGSDRVYYLATAPSLFVGICANLSRRGTDRRTRPRGAGEAAGPRPGLGAARSTTTSASTSKNSRSSGSTTTWARKRCRT